MTRPTDTVLDGVSGVLALAAWLTARIIAGDVFARGMFFGDPRLTFLFVFFSALCVVAVMIGIDALVKRMAAGAAAFIVSSVALALVFALYAHLFFRTPGGWIVPGGPGFMNSPLGFSGELALYFVAALLLRSLLFGKSKLPRRFHASVVLLCVVFAASLSELYFIFSGGR